MTEFATTELGKIAAPEKGSIAIGPFGSRMKADVYTKTGVPVIRGTNIGADKTLKGDWVFVPEEFADEIPNCIVHPGDLVFPHRGSIGEVALIPAGVERIVLSSSMMKFRADRTKAVPEFLYYYFKSKAGRAEILRFGSQVGTPGIGQPLTSLKRFVTPLPKPNVQAGIARLLASLDDKIELNRRMNDTLEEMAQALFRDWFVDFGPTHRQMEGFIDPAAIMGHAFPPETAATLAPLFPAKLGDDGLPEGWEKRVLHDLTDWVNGAAYKNMHFSTEPDALPVIKIAELKAGITKTTKHTNTALGAKFRISNGEVLFSWSGNPDTSIDTFIWSGGEAWLNQHIFAVRPNGEVDLSLLYFLLKYLRPQFAEIARDKQTTGLGHVTKQDLKGMRVCLGSRKVESAAVNLFKPLFEKLYANQQENQTLAQLRDLLLPKLMSGEIRLKDAEAEDELDTKQSNVIFATDMFGAPVLTPEQEAEREVVMVAANVDALQSDDLLVGNVRLMKANYLIHRRMGWSTSSFERRAAGPHCKRLNDDVREMARQRSWIRQTTSTNAQSKRILGNRPASKFSEVVPLVSQYGLSDAIDWLQKHFKGASRDWMECVATVDDAMQVLNRQGVEITVESIKNNVAATPEWKAKLSKSNFSDNEIRKAIKKLGEIF